MEWAIAESGYSIEELAAATRVSPEAVRDWEAGRIQPGLTQLRALASKLKRPLATFMLPGPPALPTPTLEFRHPPGVKRRALNPEERRRVREATRLQRVLTWLTSELKRQEVDLPRVSAASSAEREAKAARSRLLPTAVGQKRWQSAAAAFHAWRAALEQSGVFVLAFPMGSDACRGFSLWNDRAPVIAVNTAWSIEARIFTLFHEYGHLLTRTNSACVEGTHRRTSAQSDTVERWCEQFAAAAILPREELERLLVHRGRTNRITELDDVRKIAGHFRASLRATVLRLVDLDAAGWDLYRSVPPASDRKVESGGGAGRDRTQTRLDQYGAHTMTTFSTALQQDIVSRGDVLDYLDVAPGTLQPRGGSEEALAEID
jgi:Zn-dependent peptidase ImmA (M78 family)